MNLHADFSRQIIILPDTLPWSPSPASGVEQKMLERDGTEIARATSIVRCAPGANISSQMFDLGVEIFMLEGVLSDDKGDHGPGTYLKIGRAHV